MQDEVWIQHRIHGSRFGISARSASVSSDDDRHAASKMGKDDIPYYFAEYRQDVLHKTPPFQTAALNYLFLSKTTPKSDSKKFGILKNEDVPAGK